MYDVDENNNDVHKVISLSNCLGKPSEQKRFSHKLLFVCGAIEVIYSSMRIMATGKFLSDNVDMIRKQLPGW